MSPPRYAPLPQHPGALPTHYILKRYATRRILRGLGICLCVLALVLWRRVPAEDEPWAYDEETSTFRIHLSKNFYRLFQPLRPTQADSTVRAIAAHDAVSDACLEEWIAQGERGPACNSEHHPEPRLDIVWTWVNGSDPVHASARPAFRNYQNHYREHDELHYSMRSARAATDTWLDSRWHLVTNSYEIPAGRGRENMTAGTRLGQVPQWLKSNSTLTLHHDVDIFKPISPSPLSEEALMDWRAKVLPTFDSMAVESQLANLSPDLVSDHTIFMMDDIFLLLPLAPSSFYTAFAAPVLLMQPDLLVPPRGGQGSGEWRGLYYAASALAPRFGSRGRPYVAHFARALPLPLLHEAAAAFPDVWNRTAAARWRGGDAAHALWLGTQFVVERHREALLWSWVIAKWGASGVLRADAKASMWAELGGAESADTLDVLVPYRTSKAAWQPGSPPTRYAFVSADGYPFAYQDVLALRLNPVDTDNGWADLAARPARPRVVCTLQRALCMGRGDEDAFAVFRRVLVDEPRKCGDCIVTALVRASGPAGLAAFLPPPSSRDAPAPAHLPLTLDDGDGAQWTPPPNARAFVLRLLQRYSYALGATRTSFLNLANARPAEGKLRTLDMSRDVAMACLNDDITREDQVRPMEKVLRRWAEGRWPEKMEIER